MSELEITRVKVYDPLRRWGFVQSLGGNDLYFSFRAQSQKNESIVPKRGMFAEINRIQTRQGEQSRIINLYDPDNVDEKILEVFHAGNKLQSTFKEFYDYKGYGFARKPKGLRYLYSESNKHSGIFIHKTDIKNFQEGIRPGIIEFWLMEDKAKGPQGVCVTLL